MKQQNKNIRAEVGTQPDVNKMSESDKVRAATGKQPVLDPSYYLTLPEYKDKTLFYCSDENGEVDRMLSLGARPVPRRSKSAEVFKGINDSVSNEWEFKVVDKDKAGNPIRNYLLFMDAAEYHKYRIQPNIDKNKTIMDSMGIGVLNNEGTVMPGVKGLRTYGGNVGNGETGLRTEVTHEA
ncbi:unnamed protein product [marine sediment metagenome]|uniref:Uncharacterized protein n=1 Tax=marine sediment metagenome TaxID=412755 RepID=X0WEX4_9ZZZZ